MLPCGSLLCDEHYGLHSYGLCLVVYSSLDAVVACCRPSCENSVSTSVTAVLKTMGVYRSIPCLSSATRLLAVDGDGTHACCGPVTRNCNYRTYTIDRYTTVLMDDDRGAQREARANGLSG